MLMLLMILIFLHSVQINATKEERYVKLGGTAILNCSSLNTSDVTWSHNGTIYSIERVTNDKIPHADKISVIGDAEKGEYNLKIEKVAQSDAGLYLCNLRTDNEMEDFVFEIKVMVPPTSLRILNQTRNIIQTVVGQIVKLICIISDGIPPATLYWYRNGNYLANGTGRLMYSFKASMTNHLQHFTCLARHKALKKDLKKHVQILLSRAPIARIEAYPHDPTLGDTIMIFCNVDNPVELTNIIWKKNNQFLPFKSSGIILYNSTIDDMATYTCTVENKYGNNTSSRTVEFSDVMTIEAKSTICTTEVVIETNTHPRTTVKGDGFEKEEIIYGLSGTIFILFVCLVMSLCRYIKHNKCGLALNKRKRGFDENGAVCVQTAYYDEIDENQIVNTEERSHDQLSQIINNVNTHCNAHLTSIDCPDLNSENDRDTELVDLPKYLTCIESEEKISKCVSYKKQSRMFQNRKESILSNITDGGGTYLTPI